MTKFDELDHDETQNTQKISKIRGLNRTLEQEKHEAKQLNFEERIAKEINDDREVWLEKVNIYFEKILHKAKKDDEMLRHIPDIYNTRNKICNIGIKQLKDKLKQTLITQKEKDKVELLFEASLVS